MAGITPGKFHAWQARCGIANDHNGAEPRDFWLVAWERAAIVAFAQAHPLEGYRRLTYMMLDADVVAVSPASVYRVLKAGRLVADARANPEKGPPASSAAAAPHEHWHIDISYLNIAGTFYFLCSVLDGYSRFIVHWEIREQMEDRTWKSSCSGPRTGSRRPATDHQRQRSAVHRQGLQGVHPPDGHDPRAHLALLSAEQRQAGTLAPDPQGRVHPPQSPVSLEDARRLVAAYVTDYNTVRLHGAIGYITPQDQLLGRVETIFAARRRKLAAAAARPPTAQEHPDAAAAWSGPCPSVRGQGDHPTVSCSPGGGGAGFRPQSAGIYSLKTTGQNSVFC